MKVDKSDFDSETFTTKNIYYVGTSNGCGCNFGTEVIPEKVILEAKQSIINNEEFSQDVKQFFEYEDTIELLNISIDENKKYSEDTKKLYFLISDLCENNEFVEFFGCQADHEKNKCIEITTLDFSKERVKIEFDKFQDQNIKIKIIKRPPNKPS